MKNEWMNKQELFKDYKSERGRLIMMRDVEMQVLDLATGELAAPVARPPKKTHKVHSQLEDESETYRDSSRELARLDAEAPEPQRRHQEIQETNSLFGRREDIYETLGKQRRTVPSAPSHARTRGTGSSGSEDFFSQHRT